MQDASTDLKPLLSELGSRLGRLEQQQGTLLEEVRSNQVALLRVEGALDTRVAESRGKHDLTNQRDDAQDLQIALAHSRISTLKRGIQSALGLAVTALLSVLGMAVQWLSTK